LGYSFRRDAAFLNQFTAFSAVLAVELLIGYFNIAGMVAGNIYIHRVFTVFRNTVLDTIESIDSLDDFGHWLTAVCNRNIHLIFSIVGGVLVGIYLISVLYDTGVTIALSTVIGTILLNTQYRLLLAHRW
jgi:hypothetical protein